MNNTLVIYCPNTSERFRYIIGWLFKEQLKLNYRITNNAEDLASLSFFISYGNAHPNSFSIPDAGLLWEQDVSQKEITSGNWSDVPVLFTVSGAANSIPFDILSAAFFLLSRYEEYYAYTPDKHGRYPAEESILYKHGLLERPILDEWVHQLRILLRSKFDLTIPEAQFSFQPTYDIDIAYSYRAKGLRRTASHFLKDIVSGQWQRLSERLSVLSNAHVDPYDSYDWLRKLHTTYGIAPVYFILAALKTTRYDKNISPLHPAMRLLITRLSQEGAIGLHPSYYSNSEKTFLQEKNTLENIVSSSISISRQHYIKNILPGTYELLLANDITEDYSMGYGTHLGFRAGTGQSFLWYDLSEEKITALRVHPFCFMDTSALFQLELDVDTAFERLNGIANKLKDTGSMLITIFHNSSLGNSTEWKGWKDAYEAFIKNLH
jgi:hypothetical protein